MTQLKVARHWCAPTARGLGLCCLILTLSAPAASAAEKVTQAGRTTPTVRVAPDVRPADEGTAFPLGARFDAASLNVHELPTLMVTTNGRVWEWLEPGESSTILPGVRGSQGGVAGGCPGSVQYTHTDGSFEGGEFLIQAGFVANEIAAASYAIPAEYYPLRFEAAEAVFAQQNAIVDTVTEWTVMIWDGPPNQENLVAQFSSDDDILPHLRLPPGTQGANLNVRIDPGDPEQIFIFNDSGTGIVSIGFRIDRHNNHVGNPCLVSPPSNQNAFPVTDNSGVASLTGNWLSAVNCGALGCPAGWSRFQDLVPLLCRPSGDWLLRLSVECSEEVQIGACCTRAGDCLDDTSVQQCDLLQGTFQGTNTDCADVTCPPPVGACCLGSTCLTNLTADECAVVAGDYLGDGSTCSANACQAAACCLPDGTCQNVIPAECETLEGEYQGAGTLCSGVECPQPTGACCINTVCINGQSREVCEAVGVWQGMNTTCVTVSCGVDCPPATIVSALPPSGTIDARMPHPLNDASLEARMGIGSASEPITIDIGFSGADASCFTLCESGQESLLGPNAIEQFVDNLDGTYDLVLHHPIATGCVTTISYEDGSWIRYTSHPANANGDARSSAADILSLIDYVNGVSTPPHGRYGADIDHSGGNPLFFDVLRLIDLLNGAELFDPWIQSELPTQGDCP